MESLKCSEFRAGRNRRLELGGFKSSGVSRAGICFLTRLERKWLVAAAARLITPGGRSFQLYYFGRPNVMDRLWLVDISRRGVSNCIVNGVDV